MTMSGWSIAEAKARFSELVLHVRERPQHVLKRGKEVAIVLSTEEYARLRAEAERREPHAMRSFLATAERLRNEGNLELSLPRRRPRRQRKDPFAP